MNSNRDSTRVVFLFALFLLFFTGYACTSGLAGPTPLSLTPSASTDASLAPTPSETQAKTSLPVYLPTATVFAPLILTPTFTSTHVQTPTDKPPVWLGYPGPTVTPVTPIPPPRTLVELSPETHVALLLGVDRDAPLPGPTDTIILVFYNTKFAKASIVSIPRDLFIYVPGYEMQRVNTAYELGGIDLLNLTLRYNFGLDASQWAVIHLDDFQNFVDQLGGIKIRGTYGVKDPWCDVPAGKTMDMGGYLALCYVRSRTGNSDLDRNQRQQQVFQAILKEVGRNSNLSRFTEFYERYQSSVQTNLVLQDVLDNVPLLLQLREENHVAFFSMGWDDVITWQAPPKQASVLLLREHTLDAILNKAIKFTLSP